MKKHGHPKFYLLLKDMADLHSRKNHDYSTSADPLSNLRQSEQIGIPAHIGVIIRLMDKWDRVKQLISKKKALVKNESLRDTLMDNAVYSLLAIILLEEKDISEQAERMKKKYEKTKD